MYVLSLHDVAKSGAWLAAFSFISNVISWGFTIYVARLLVPEDYGLMTMASFLTAFIQVFSSLGLGAAIIQRSSVNQKELSSIFWFSLAIGVVLFFITFLIAQPTALIFNEERLIPVVYCISVLFIISSLNTVPQSLQSRRFGFKSVGGIRLIATVIASVAQIFMAQNGFGVYTLIFGLIILRLTGMILTAAHVKWVPNFYFNYSGVKPYLNFGVHLAVSSTLRKILESLDKYIVGRFFGAQNLGVYSYGMTLSNMPIDKVWPIFQQVSFPLLSSMQNSLDDFQRVYFDILKLYLLLVFPIFIGGALYAEHIVNLLLGEKWLGVIPFFKVFCIVRLFDSLVHFTNLLHIARGKPNRVTKLTVVQAVLMTIGVFLAAQLGLYAVPIAWLIIMPTIGMVWIALSLRILDISTRAYLHLVFSALKYSLIMVISIEFVLYIFTSIANIQLGSHGSLGVEIFVGGISYALSLFVFEKEFIRKSKNMLLNKT